MAKRPEWLDTAVFYEIYPQSFKDTDGDGIGNIDGITALIPRSAMRDMMWQITARLHQGTGPTTILSGFLKRLMSWGCM